MNTPGVLPDGAETSAGAVVHQFDRILSLGTISDLVRHPADHLDSHHSHLAMGAPAGIEVHSAPRRTCAAAVSTLARALSSTLIKNRLDCDDRKDGNISWISRRAAARSRAIEGLSDARY